MKVLVVIPTLRGQAPVVKDLEGQSFRDFELRVVRGVSPNGKARNQGWQGTEAQIVVFIDDDARLGHGDILSNLIKPIREGRADIVGASRRLPKDANWFSRAASAQIPLIETPIVNNLTPANPALVRKSRRDQDVWSAVTTTCCAMKREVLERAKGFNEKIMWGVDTEFFYRARKLGYKFALAPNTWVYHPYASNLPELWKKYFKSGLGTAQEMKLAPERKLKMRLKTPLHTLGFFLYRTLASLGLVLALRPLRAIGVFATTTGYVYGWYKTKL